MKQGFIYTRAFSNERASRAHQPAITLPRDASVTETCAFRRGETNVTDKTRATHLSSEKEKKRRKLLGQMHIHITMRPVDPSGAN